MATPKPNLSTTCYEGKYGDREYVFSCRGRPFSVLTAPLFPTPAFTMIDHNLVRELKLRLTDLQCVKFTYGGQKLRILGKVNTTVQCVLDGVPAGNFQFKAHVVQDIYQLFDTHAIAGVKMSEKLSGMKFAGKPVELNTEPTKKDAKKKKSKVKGSVESSPTSSGTDSRSLSPSTPPTATPPRPVIQGRWIKKQWVPHAYTFPEEFASYYINRETGEEEYEKPLSWDSDGSQHSPSSAKSFHASSDEYGDVYSNKSVIIKAPPDDVESSQNFTLADQKLVRRIWKEGEDIPHHLQHVPIPHGANWCDPDCLYLGDLPPDCGYHARWGRVDHCCPECTGGWCGHTRSMPGRDWMS